MNRLKRGALNASLALVATIVAIGVAEGMLRVFSPRATSIFDQDRYGLAMLYPSITRYLPEFDHEVSTNSAGLRDREHSLAKPEGTFRILVLGDSFMEAVQVNFESSLPSLLEESLNREDRGKTIEVINAGVSGWGTDDQLRYLTQYGLAYDPDLVVIVMTLHNDIQDNLRQQWHTLQEGRLVERDPEPIPFLEFELQELKTFIAVRLQLVQIWYRFRHAREIAQATQALQSHVVALFEDPPPPQMERGFRMTESLLGELKSVMSQRGGNVAVALIPLSYQLSDSVFADFVAASGMPDEEMAMYSPQRRVVASAERLDLPIIDLLPRFQQWNAERDAPLYLKGEGHWTVEGHRLATEVLVERLEALQLVP